MTSVFKIEEETIIEQGKPIDIPLFKIPKHIIRFALSKNPFFYFDNLTKGVKCFPHINSLSDFIESTEYLGSLEIRFNGSKARLAALTNDDYLLAIQGLLQNIESEIKSNLTEFEGSEKPGNPTYLE